MNGKALKMKKIVSRYVFPVLLWSGAFLVVYFCIAALFSTDSNQLLQPHLKAKGATAFKNLDSFFSIRKMIVQDYDIFLLALIGTVVLVRQKKWHSLFPLIWFLLAFILLLNHKPVWYHHYLLLSIPLAWLAAICLGEFFRVDIRREWIPKMRAASIVDTLLRWVMAGAVILVIVITPSKFQRIYTSIEGTTLPQDRHIVDLLVKYSPKTAWVVTDRQIFPFYANLPVPPELAVTSLKRKWTGNLTSDYFLNILQKYRPEQILFNRYPTYSPMIMAYIRKNYLKVYHHQNTRLYIHKDIIGKTSEYRTKSEPRN